MQPFLLPYTPPITQINQTLTQSHKPRQIKQKPPQKPHSIWQTMPFGKHGPLVKMTYHFRYQKILPEYQRLTKVP